MMRLRPHQIAAVEKLRNGNILLGRVGSGKTLTALAYFYTRIGGGTLEIMGDNQTPMTSGKKLYIITTAKNRDDSTWVEEILKLGDKVDYTVDSWNNIKKYTGVNNSFFIFDEQRVVGSRSWAKSFIKIAKNNEWIMLSATPGDSWVDYVSVFIANGFYKNRTEFMREHCVLNPFLNFPKIDRYLGVGKLIRQKESIVYRMPDERTTERVVKDVYAQYDREELSYILEKRWDVSRDQPIENASGLCQAMRKCVNSHPSRIEEVRNILRRHRRAIIFYNYNYELDILRDFCRREQIDYGEWNGHKHEPLPTTQVWLYLVHYAAGAEGWNCIETNCTIFYSLSYSYRAMEQSMGRIDRLNTPFTHLYYYRLVSVAPIDLAIMKALRLKKDFNENRFNDI